MRIAIKQRDPYWYEVPHRWFAWFPVRINTGWLDDNGTAIKGELVWLETLERVDGEPLHDCIIWNYRRTTSKLPRN